MISKRDMSIVLRQADALHHLKGRESLLRSYLLRLLGTDVSHVERAEVCVKVSETKSTPLPLMIDYRAFPGFPPFCQCSMLSYPGTLY